MKRTLYPPDFRKVVLGIPFSWESQAVQHKLTDTPGIHYEEVCVIEGYPIDDLTLYDEAGDLVGILYRYPLGAPGFEVPMSINLYVKPSERRKGIGTKLVAEAERRWGPIRWDRQRFTREGAALVRNYLREGY